MNSNEVTEEDEEYDPDFIDDSEPVDIDTYNSEWAELYGIPARKSLYIINIYYHQNLSIHHNNIYIFFYSYC